jgi:hypothetical protein
MRQESGLKRYAEVWRRRQGCELGAVHADQIVESETGRPAIESLDSSGILKLWRRRGRRVCGVTFALRQSRALLSSTGKMPDYVRGATFLLPSAVLAMSKAFCFN